MDTKQLDIKDFLKASKEKILIDVRSPSEFQKGHIKGAVNIPLFDDEQRKKVGTTYKQQGSKDAVLLGLELIQPELRSIVENVSDLIKDKKEKDVYLYCWRGGARSESYSWLLNSCGINSVRLKSGYKAYRNLVLDSFKKDYKFILLGGKTGCGKTDILEEIKKKNEQVIDLEGIACHKGSVFGDLGQPAQPAPQQFENNLFHELYSLNSDKIIWMENESPGIGNLFIPFDLRETKKKSPVLDINLPKTEREKRIIKEYGYFNIDLLCERVNKIKKKLGSENCKDVIKYLKNNELNRAISILINYYDKSYTHSLNKNSSNGKIIINLDLLKDNPKDNAVKIIKEFYSYQKDKKQHAQTA